MLGSIFPELRVAPLVDPGTDCEDELPAPADPPAIVDQEMDSELQNVFIVSLGPGGSRGGERSAQRESRTAVEGGRGALSGTAGDGVQKKAALPQESCTGVEGASQSDLRKNGPEKKIGSEKKRESQDAQR